MTRGMWENEAWAQYEREQRADTPIARRTMKDALTHRCATWADRKRADGWEPCPTCGGHGVLGGYGITDRCPDCAYGLVPLEETVYAGAVPISPGGVPDYEQLAESRAVLVAAARKENE